MGDFQPPKPGRREPLKATRSERIAGTFLCAMGYPNQGKASLASVKPNGQAIVTKTQLTRQVGTVWRAGQRRCSGAPHGEHPPEPPRSVEPPIWAKPKVLPSHPRSRDPAWGHLEATASPSATRGWQSPILRCGGPGQTPGCPQLAQDSSPPWGASWDRVTRGSWKTLAGVLSARECWLETRSQC